MSSPMTFIQPQFEIMERGRGGLQGPGDRRSLVARTKDSWAGSVVYASSHDPVRLVSGMWTVPAVVRPPQESGPYCYSTWVGIDGAAHDEGGSTDILQAGTAQDGSGDPYAFWEWYDEPRSKIPSLKVRPGDVMFCSIEVLSPAEANILMMNMTTRLSTVFNKPANGRHVVGDTVEWILETPQDANGVPFTLSEFSWVYFDQCVAFTGSRLLLAGQGHLWNQTDVNDKVIAESVAMTDRLFAVTYTA